MKKILRIISLPVDDGGCGFYRIRKPFEMIKRFTDHDAYIIDTKDNMQSVTKALLVADLVVSRPGSEEGMNQLRENYPILKSKPWVLDIDDNTEIISPYNEHYFEYGTREFYDNNAKKWLWKDGVDRWNITENKKKLDWLIWGLKNCSMVTTTTDKLAEYAGQYNKHVAILPNCIDFGRWWKLDLKPNKTLRVGWSGGISHYEDWYSIREPLNQLMREYKFTLVVAGNSFQGLIDEDNKERVESHDWVPFKGHSYRMMTLGLDIALIPLADTPFNKYKSSIKLYEMSAMGVPSVVSNILPYKEDIDDGLPCRRYSNPKQFYHELKSLLEDNYRDNLGLEAQKWVQTHRDAKKCVGQWVNVYKRVVENS